MQKYPWILLGNVFIRNGFSTNKNLELKVKKDVYNSKKKRVPFETEMSCLKEGTKKQVFFMSKKNIGVLHKPPTPCHLPNLSTTVMTRKLRDQCLGNKDHATDCSQWLPALREAWYPRDHREPNIRSRNKLCNTGWRRNISLRTQSASLSLASECNSHR